jgi:hypothetical protein
MISKNPWTTHEHDLGYYIKKMGLNIQFNLSKSHLGPLRRVSPATNLKNKPATATPKGGARRGR